jgi:hypothetical protein
VPVILLFGPCCHYEQRPLGNVLLIGNDDNICSYVFETRYYFSQSREELFAVTDESLVNLNISFARYQQLTQPHTPLMLRETNCYGFSKHHYCRA